MNDIDQPPKKKNCTHPSPRRKKREPKSRKDPRLESLKTSHRNYRRKKC